MLPHETSEALLARKDGEPHRLTGFTWVERFLQGGAPAREVPETHWEAEEHELGFTVALLRCVCGVSHSLVPGQYPQRCRCPRWFFYTGTQVFALNGPEKNRGEQAAA